MKKNKLTGKELSRSAPRGQKKVLPQAAQRNMIPLIVNSILFLFIYFGSMNIQMTVIPADVLTPYPILIGQCVSLFYWLAFAGFLIAYILYNRAFKFKGVTEEMLPDTWTKEQKASFIEDTGRRYERSKWMLSVIIPLLVTIAADAVYLFTWPMIQNLFNIS